MNITTVFNDLTRDEGFSATAYKDSLGYLTVGYGLCIDEKAAGAGITEEEARMLLEHRVLKLRNQVIDAIPTFDTLPDPVQRALINMAYQLGIAGLKGFKRMLLAIEARDWNAAAEEASDSKWAKQTPNRAQRVTDLMRSAA